MNTYDLKRVCSLLHTIATQMHRYQSDLIIELPKIMSKLQSNETPTLIIRKNGADLIDRFFDCLDDRTPHTRDNAIMYARKSLGVDYTIDICCASDIITLTNYGLSEADWDSLVMKFKTYHSQTIIKTSNKTEDTK